MANIHPFMFLAFVLLVAVALTQVPHLASAPDALRMEAGRMEAGRMEAAAAEAATAGEAATPREDPHLARLGPPPSTETVAMPKHELQLTQFAQPAAAETVAMPNQDSQPAPLAQPPAAETVAMPNHDPGHLRPMPSFVVNPVTLKAEPEPAAPAAAVVVDADTFADTETTLYARDGARLRAAPSTAADILTKLTADTPLQAVARSTDGTWWRVSLPASAADEPGRIGYVHRVAVTKDRVVAAKAPVAPAPFAAVAAPQPVSASRSQGLRGTVEETIDWLADTAARGSARKSTPTER